MVALLRFEDGGSMARRNTGLGQFTCWRVFLDLQHFEFAGLLTEPLLCLMNLISFNFIKLAKWDSKGAGGS